MSTPSEPSPPPGPDGDRPPSTAEIPVVSPVGTPPPGPTTGGATAVGRSLPPHPDAARPTPVPVAAPLPTGPVDFVPGLPGLGTPPVPPPTTPPAPPAPSPMPTQPPVPAPLAPGSPEGEPAATGPAWPDTLEADAAHGKRRAPRFRGDRTALLAAGLAALAVLLLLVGLSLGFGAVSFWSAVPLWSAFATVCTLLGLGALAATSLGGDREKSGAAWRVAAAGLVGLAVFWLLVVLPRVDTDRGFVLTAALACLGGALWIGSRPRA